MSTKRKYGSIRPKDGEPDSEDQTGPRSRTQRDADRVLYSSAFRRLSGVTQVVSPQDDFVYHDRLQHSLKVAQVAHRLAQALQDRRGETGKNIDPDAAYAASLAHDLGHPPFGHAAETALCRVLQGTIDRAGNLLAPGTGTVILKDGFDANAQTFRIVNVIGYRKEAEEQFGLNLTWRSLGAILKYPWVWDGAKDKWGAYLSEKDILEKSVSRAKTLGLFGFRSIEAEIMDWSDDVAYAVHDVEDFYRAGLLPLSRLKKIEGKDWSDFKKELCKVLVEVQKEDKTNVVCRP